MDQAERKPIVPKVTDHIATPMRTRRSFVHKNALEAMVSEPTALDNPQFVDAPQVRTLKYAMEAFLRFIISYHPKSKIIKNSITLKISHHKKQSGLSHLYLFPVLY